VLVTSGVGESLGRLKEGLGGITSLERFLKTAEGWMSLLRILLSLRFVVEACGEVLLDRACAADTPPRNEIGGC
jgi:hypothetical protein